MIDRYPGGTASNLESCGGMALMSKIHLGLQIPIKKMRARVHVRGREYALLCSAPGEEVRAGAFHSPGTPRKRPVVLTQEDNLAPSTW